MSLTKVLKIFNVTFIFVALLPVVAFTQETWEPEKSFSTPGSEPACITWNGKTLWLADNNTKKIYQLDPQNGSVINSINLAVEVAKGIAWDGSNLWVLDDGTKMIYKVSSENGNILTKIKAPAPMSEGEWSLEGLAWDGKNLWVAYYAGFSSKINQVDPKDGSILQSFFSDSHPRGLATDGERIWTICYNGEKLPAAIDVRKISGNSFNIAKSRSFLAKLSTKDTIGLAFDGNNLWVVDKRNLTLNKFKIK